MRALAAFSFHHFGLAVVDPVRATSFVAQLGYHCSSAVFDPLQHVHLRWCECYGAPAIEIVSPADRDGPLGRILTDRPSSFYHLCYEIEVTTTDALDTLRVGGARVVTVLAPLPAVLFDGRNVSFHMVQGFGLIELLEAEGVGART